MHEAAKGLDFLNSSQHKIGDSVGAVQHCDVKPDNLMLTGGSVVIADFGVAQTLAHARLDATATSLGGTPAYMPPELFANKPARTTDQYSLAVTYYELRTGALPFVDQTYAAVFQAHHQGTLDFLARASRPSRKSCGGRRRRIRSSDSRLVPSSSMRSTRASDTRRAILRLGRARAARSLPRRRLACVVGGCGGWLRRVLVA